MLLIESICCASFSVGNAQNSDAQLLWLLAAQALYTELKEIQLAGSKLLSYSAQPDLSYALNEIQARRRNIVELRL
jgi:hypothetical protein